MIILQEPESGVSVHRRKGTGILLRLLGEKGIIRFSTFTFEPIVLINGNGRQEFINERPEHVQYYLIEKIVRALAGKGEAVSTGISGAQNKLGDG